ncbi:MAG: sulfatase family protein [Actinomycetota bacterium]
MGRTMRALMGAIALVGMGMSAAPGSVGGASSRPNIVVIMADDLDVESLAVLRNHGFMPNLERYVARPGIEFRNSFVTYSLCCPSRATFLTGQYAHNHMVRGNQPPTGGVAALDDSSTIATWLQDGGYRTAHIGKYLNQYGTDKDGSTASPRDDSTYVPPGWSEWRGLVDPSTYLVFDYAINHNGTVRSYRQDPPAYRNYQTDVLARSAAGFIRGATNPFFLVVTPLAPHVEAGALGVLPLPRCDHNRWQAWIRPDPKDRFAKPFAWETIGRLPMPSARKPSFNEKNVEDKPAFIGRQPRLTPRDIGCVLGRYRSQLRSMLAVDDLIGAVGRELEERGALGNTVIVFTSDNGYLHGEHRWGSKVLAYEESIRVPLLMRIPGIAGPGKVDEVVLNNDLAPTLAALGEVQPGLPVDGRSILPLLEQTPPGQWRTRFLVESEGGSVPELPRGRIPGFTAVRTFGNPPLTYVAYSAGADGIAQQELYNLTADPYQTRSVDSGARWRETIALLRAQALLLETCGRGTCQLLEWLQF